MDIPFSRLPHVPLPFLLLFSSLKLRRRAFNGCRSNAPDDVTAAFTPHTGEDCAISWQMKALHCS